MRREYCVLSSMLDYSLSLSLTELIIIRTAFYPPILITPVRLVAQIAWNGEVEGMREPAPGCARGCSRVTWWYRRGEFVSSRHIVSDRKSIPRDFAPGRRAARYLQYLPATECSSPQRSGIPVWNFNPPIYATSERYRVSLYILF